MVDTNVCCIIVKSRGRGFKQKFYHKFGPTVKGFSRALKIEKYKSPAIPRPHDFCMIIGI